jgi:hypothetical protein
VHCVGEEVIQSALRLRSTEGRLGVRAWEVPNGSIRAFACFEPLVACEGSLRPWIRQIEWL